MLRGTRIPVLVGVGASYYCYKSAEDWYLKYPITGTMAPADFPHSSWSSHKRLIQELNSASGPYKCVILTGPHGSGKSTTVLDVTQGEMLKEWYTKEKTIVNYVFPQKHLDKRPWFLMHYKGQRHDPTNKQFGRYMADMLNKVLETYSDVGIVPYYSVRKLFEDLDKVETYVDVIAKLPKLLGNLFSAFYPFQLAKVEEKEINPKLLEDFAVYLADRPGWVIILDDIQSFKGIVDYLPKSGGTVIITTNKDALSQEIQHAKVVHVNGFNADEAEKYIKDNFEKYPNLKYEESDVEKLLLFLRNGNKLDIIRPIHAERACRANSIPQISECIS